MWGHRALFLVLLAAVVLSPARPPLSAQNAAKTALSALDLQILLDCAGFSPGEIDGNRGANTASALAGFRTARATASGDLMDDAAVAQALGAGTIETLTNYAITDKDAAGPFTAKVPDDMMEKAKLKALHYSSVIEAIGERFHVSPAVLRQLNPGARFVAGEGIRVPNVGDRPASVAARIAVSKSRSTLTALDQAGSVLFQAPVTSGSGFDPLPIGEWTVLSVNRNPTFNYNPDLFWDADPTHAKARIPAGPNGPVGVVWIDISKPHYGIHGTPEPGTVGHTTSHGCVRLTNWDALRLAAMVGKGTAVEFTE